MGALDGDAGCDGWQAAAVCCFLCLLLLFLLCLLAGSAGRQLPCCAALVPVLSIVMPRIPSNSAFMSLSHQPAPPYIFSNLTRDKHISVIIIIIITIPAPWYRLFTAPQSSAAQMWASRA